MKVVFATLLLVSLLLSSTFLEIATADYSSICENKCVVRCSEAGEQKRCMEYCGMCCEECDACVPSGTSGNKWECPCYQNKLNSKGGPKCP